MKTPQTTPVRRHGAGNPQRVQRRGRPTTRPTRGRRATKRPVPRTPPVRRGGCPAYSCTGYGPYGDGDRMHLARG
eukprot:1595572-Prymnesium_polylepis.1